MTPNRNRGRQSERERKRERGWTLSERADRSGYKHCRVKRLFLRWRLHMSCSFNPMQSLHFSLQTLAFHMWLETVIYWTFIHFLASFGQFNVTTQQIKLPDNNKWVFVTSLPSCQTQWSQCIFISGLCSSRGISRILENKCVRNLLTEK